MKPTYCFIFCSTGERDGCCQKKTKIKNKKSCTSKFHRNQISTAQNQKQHKTHANQAYETGELEGDDLASSSSKHKKGFR